MSFTFETEPLVPDINLSEIEIEEVKREIVDEKKIEQTLKNIQTYFVEWEKISDRSAKDDDFAIIDVDIIEKDPAENILSNARFEIKKDKMAHWMYEMIVGMKIGDSKEGVSKPDEDASKEDKDTLSPSRLSASLFSPLKNTLRETE